MSEPNEKTIGWCDNSRVWIGIMAFNPNSCPYSKPSEGHCCEVTCGYYRERKPTKYVLRKLMILRGGRR